MIEIVIISAFLGGISGLIGYGLTQQRNHSRYRRSLNIPSHALYRDWWQTTKFCIHAPGESKIRWQHCIVVLTHKHLALYRYPELEPQFSIKAHQIQGFWRPQKYERGPNEIWIHARVGSTWRILKMTLHKTQMPRLVRALKSVSTEEQIQAYRRRRPYIHHGPALAYPAQQTLQGAWELARPLLLYIMPLNLIILRDDVVENVLPLSEIQEIAALKRMEGGEPAGLIRFTVHGEVRAFATNDYEALAAILAEAAKRTLEEPLIRKRKVKDDDDDDDA